MAASLGKELSALARERRLLIYLLLVGGLMGFAFTMFFLDGFQEAVSPFELAEFHHYAAPVLTGVLALLMAGDHVARERQDRTIQLLFTAPMTKARLLAASIMGHLAAFGAFAAVLLSFALIAGLLVGPVILGLTAAILFAALLPLYLVLDWVLLAVTTRFRNGRASLVVSALLVVSLWATGGIGAFGWALGNVEWWQTFVSSWHPFDLAAEVSDGLLHQGIIAWSALATLAGEALVALGAAGWTFHRMEVGS